MAQGQRTLPYLSQVLFAGLIILLLEMCLFHHNRAFLRHACTCIRGFSFITTPNELVFPVRAGTGKVMMWSNKKVEMAEPKRPILSRPFAAGERQV